MLRACPTTLSIVLTDTSSPYLYPRISSSPGCFMGPMASVLSVELTTVARKWLARTVYETK